ncbi:hypothetical protein PVAND_001561 [Polypedilum vanderplanki]|uniref:Uncharacterized protein n=1 Tax=Polypedilum vanderplanki TaxID=319348 RepID=A0A9J6BNS9_POLVA|nr:hypothetical protein PVAND_001561 [Polypedilum vanderplanki]
MTSSILILLLHVVNFIAADWIKLPSISPTTAPPPTTTILTSSHSQNVPKVVFKLAPPPDPDIFSSETMSSIFSYRPTTKPTEFPSSSTKKSYIRKNFHTTVTSKVVHFPGNVSNLVDNNEFIKPIVLDQENKKTNNVRFYNKTVAMNVIPLKSSQLIINDEMKFTMEEEKDEDDGVTITVDDDDANNSSIDEEGYEADDELDDYYYEEDELNKFPEPYKNKQHQSSTTEMPKAHKKSHNKIGNAQRRMQLLQKSSRKPFPNINFPTFINFIKKIQESFAMRTAKSIGEKIKMLMSFRDRLMLAINHQIKRLWVKQPRVTKTKKRGKRTIGGEEWMEHKTSNAMDFPSVEGALLSICFLTFAVFLIKLVLQVIQTIKMKKAMWATQMINTGGTETVVIKRRNERAIQSDEDYYYLLKTLDSIHNLKVH